MFEPNQYRELCSELHVSEEKLEEVIQMTEQEKKRKFHRPMRLGLVAAAVAGGCLGFLLWNFNPAKVFMGDTGSLFLGGAVCALTFGMDLPILLIPLGIIYWMEIGSVMLQVTYFKLTHGKRLFKMSPIHHHFEMCGWSEIKICGVFSLVTVIFGILSLVWVIFGV